ncbi:uncharacterized protein V1518DRAFT_145390 [Limtongia smithiae]|uniref:uncharacterized protein n=1 Tax=Limtongia smithiae TaxID=1125753 RepID=UPI0034D011C1
MSFKSVVIAYLVGGVTFIPLVIFAVLYYIYNSLPEVDANGNIIAVPDPNSPRTEEQIRRDREEERKQNDKTAAEEKLRELENQVGIGVDAYMTGWLAVSREFKLQRSTASDKSGSLNETAYTSIYKHLMDRKQASASTPSLQSTTMPSPDGKPRARPKKMTANTYFAVLRHGNLFLYDTPEQMNVQQVIVLANHAVTIWPPDAPDGQLFIRRNAICLIPKTGNRAFHGRYNPAEPPKHAYYLFSESCSEKEDFYFALLRASMRVPRKDLDGSTQGRHSLPGYPDPLVDAHPLSFNDSDIVNLMRTLHSSDSHLETMWLNALIGRMFLALNQTAALENFVKSRIDTKLSRVNRPSFLGDITVTKVHCGTSPPFLTNPKLKEFSKDGMLTVAANLSYEGDFKLEIATKATINLGSRFKTREVSLVLLVAFKKLEGCINFSLKPPPSNRFWYCFESMPNIEMYIEPVVSSRQITYSMVTRVIESRILETLRDSLVYPYMDDLAFFDTSCDFFRGGIWDRSVRDFDKTSQQDPTSPASNKAEEIEESTESRPTSELQQHMDNLSMSSNMSTDSDRRNLSEDAVSVPELKFRRKDSISGEVRSSGGFTAPVPAVVATDRVNIVYVDGKVTSHSPSTAPSSSPSLGRTSSRSSGRSSFSRSEAELFHRSSTAQATIGGRTSNNEDIPGVSNIDSTDEITRSDTTSERSFRDDDDHPTISDSVKKWSSKYFATAKKNMTSRINNNGSLSSTTSPTSLHEDQIQKRIIEAQLLQNGIPPRSEIDSVSRYTSANSISTSSRAQAVVANRSMSPSSPSSMAGSRLFQPPPISPTRRKLVDHGERTTPLVAKSPVPPPPSMERYSSAPREPRPYTAPSSDGATAATLLTQAEPYSTSSVVREPTRAVARKPVDYGDTDSGLLVSRLPVSQLTSSISTVMHSTSAQSEHPDDSAENTESPDADPADETLQSEEHKNEIAEGSNIPIPIPTTPRNPRDQFDLPPVSFVDLVDEGNSLGLGSGYDYTSSHQLSSYSSSPSYSSSAGSAYAWTDHRHNTHDSVNSASGSKSSLHNGGGAIEGLGEGNSTTTITPSAASSDTASFTTEDAL